MFPAYVKSQTHRGPGPARARLGRSGTPRWQGALKGSALGPCVLGKETGGSESRGVGSSCGCWCPWPSCVSAEKRVTPSWASRPRCLGRWVDSVLGGGGGSRSAISVFLLETVGRARRSSRLRSKFVLRLPCPGFWSLPRRPSLPGPAAELQSAAEEPFSASAASPQAGRGAPPLRAPRGGPLAPLSLLSEDAQGRVFLKVCL